MNDFEFCSTHVSYDGLLYMHKQGLFSSNEWIPKLYAELLLYFIYSDNEDEWPTNNCCSNLSYTFKSPKIYCHSCFEIKPISWWWVIQIGWHKRLENFNLLNWTLSDCIIAFLVGARFYLYGPIEATRSLPRTHSRDIAAGFGATVPPKPTGPDGVCSRVIWWAATF